MPRLHPAKRTPAETPAEAIAQRAEAQICRAKAEMLPVGEPYRDRFLGEAELYDGLSSAGIALTTTPSVGCGGELVPTDGELRDTVRHPDLTTAIASRTRVELAAEAGSLELAIDVAETIEAKNSLEKILAHQVAACHTSAMKLISRAEKELNRSDAMNEHHRHNSLLSANRLFGTAARLMVACQGAAETVHKLRTGGKQTVIVQHVQVGSGGQSVVVGNLTRGRVDGGSDGK